MSHTIKSCAYILVLGLILKFKFCCTHKHDKKHWFYGIFLFLWSTSFFLKRLPLSKSVQKTFEDSFLLSVFVLWWI